MKRWITVLLFGFIMMWNTNVQATEVYTAEEIIEKSNQRMNEIKVFRVAGYLEEKGQKQLFMEIAVDANTNISYMNMLGIEIYADVNENLMYMYNSRDNRWYLMIGEESGEDTTTEEADDYMQIDQQTIVSYEYKGVSTYYGNQCETILVTATQESGETAEMTYYILCETYEICGYSMYQDEMGIEVVYTYPESITIPSYVAKNAVLFAGEVITYKGVEYTSMTSGKNVVLKVTNGKKVTSSNVTIPDSVSVAGKKYKVAEIAGKAFQGNKKIKKLTLGKNVKKIGDKAFYKCKNLKTITIKSSKLTKKNIGKNALKGTNKRLIIKAPKKMVKKYKTYFKNAGNTTVKVKKG